MKNGEVVGGGKAGASAPPRSPLSGLRVLRIGSCSAAKIEAARRAFTPYIENAEDLQMLAIEVASGVAEQPIGFEEIVCGARNRAHAAHRSGPCELAVGIEDGLVEVPGLGEDVLNVGAACVFDGRRESVGLSSGFAYPPECSHSAIAQREPIGALFDSLWRRCARAAGGLALSNGAGNIGKLTLGVLPRSEYGCQAILCALVRFLNPELYGDTRGGGFAANRGGSVDE